MTDDAPDDNTLRPGASRRWIRPVAVAFIAGFLLLFGAFLVLDNLRPSQSDDGASSSEKGASVFDEGFLKSFTPAFHDGCVKSATSALIQRSVDPTANGVDAKIEAYCTCATDRTTAELSIPELVAFKLKPSSEPAATKMKNIVQECQAKVGEIAP